MVGKQGSGGTSAGGKKGHATRQINKNMADIKDDEIHRLNEIVRVTTAEKDRIQQNMLIVANAYTTLLDSRPELTEHEVKNNNDPEISRLNAIVIAQKKQITDLERKLDAEAIDDILKAWPEQTKISSGLRLWKKDQKPFETMTVEVAVTEIANRKRKVEEYLETLPNKRKMLTMCQAATKAQWSEQAYMVGETLSMEESSEHYVQYLDKTLQEVIERTVWENQVREGAMSTVTAPPNSLNNDLDNYEDSDEINDDE